MRQLIICNPTTESNFGEAGRRGMRKCIQITEPTYSTITSLGNDSRLRTVLLGQRTASMPGASDMRVSFTIDSEQDGDSEAELIPYLPVL